MNKTSYSAPEMQILILASEDVMTASGGNIYDNDEI